MAIKLVKQTNNRVHILKDDVVIFNFNPDNYSFISDETHPEIFRIVADGSSTVDHLFSFHYKELDWANCVPAMAASPTDVGTVLNYVGSNFSKGNSATPNSDAVLKADLVNTFGSTVIDKTVTARLFNELKLQVDGNYSIQYVNTITERNALITPANASQPLTNAIHVRNTVGVPGISGGWSRWMYSGTGWELINSKENLEKLGYIEEAHHMVASIAARDAIVNPNSGDTVEISATGEIYKRITNGWFKIGNGRVPIADSTTNPLASPLDLFQVNVPFTIINETAQIMNAPFGVATGVRATLQVSVGHNTLIKNLTFSVASSTVGMPESIYRNSTVDGNLFAANWQKAKGDYLGRFASKSVFNNMNGNVVPDGVFALLGTDLTLYILDKGSTATVDNEKILSIQGNGGRWIRVTDPINEDELTAQSSWANIHDPYIAGQLFVDTNIAGGNNNLVATEFYQYQVPVSLNGLAKATTWNLTEADRMNLIGRRELKNVPTILRIRISASNTTSSGGWWDGGQIIDTKGNQYPLRSWRVVAASNVAWIGSDPLNSNYGIGSNQGTQWIEFEYVSNTIATGVTSVSLQPRSSFASTRIDQIIITTSERSHIFSPFARQTERFTQATGTINFTSPVRALATLSQHDLGQPRAALSKGVGTIAHLEGGGGYSMIASDYADNYFATITNTVTTGVTLETLTFAGYAGAFLRDGKALNAITSPYTIEKNTIIRVESVENGGAKFLNLSYIHRKQEEVLKPVTQRDGGATVPIDLSSISGTPAHLEGGAGFTMAANNYEDAYYATITNDIADLEETIEVTENLIFTEFAGAFLREGGERIPIISPYEVRRNSVLRVEVAANGANKFLNVSYQNLPQEIPDPILPTSQGDFGQATPLNLSPILGTIAHFEGGAGFTMTADNYADNYAAILTNTLTTSALGVQNLFFSNFAGVFLRDGKIGANATVVTSPYVVELNSILRVEVRVNEGQRFLNLVYSYREQGAVAFQESNPIDVVPLPATAPVGKLIPITNNHDNLDKLVTLIRGIDNPALTKVAKPTLVADAGKLLQVNATGTDVEFTPNTLGNKVDKPTLVADAGKLLQVNATGTNVEYIPNTLASKLDKPNNVADVGKYLRVNAVGNNVELVPDPSLTKIAKPTLIADANKLLQVNAAGNDVVFVTNNVTNKVNLPTLAADANKFLRVNAAGNNVVYQHMRLPKFRYDATVQVYFDVNWTSRSVGTCGAPDELGIRSLFYNPDGANHIQCGYECAVMLSASFMSSEGGGMTIGLVWQKYANGGWHNIGTWTDTSHGSTFRGSAFAQTGMGNGQYIRLITRASDNGGNTYPGNRSVRIIMEEL